MGKRLFFIGVCLCSLLLATMASAQDSPESLLSALTQKYIYALMNEAKIDQGSTDDIDTFKN